MTDARYGYYRYGRHEYEPPERDREETETPTDEITPREAFGAGVALKSGREEGIAWDFVVDSSGDLASTEGYDELGKNIAFSTAVEAKDALGSLMDANDRSLLETRMETLARQYPDLESARAEVLSGSQRGQAGGLGDSLNPDSNVVDVALEASIDDDLSQRLGLSIPL